jgi:hypothetical protein
LQLQAQNSDKDWLEEIVPLAIQKLCQLRAFLLEVSSEELEFIGVHGRRWKAGEGFDFATLPQVPKVVFDRAP